MKQLKLKKEVKYLGMVFDSKLSFKQQIEQVIWKVKTP